MTTIYVLHCEHGMFYVGQTDRPIYTRVFEHFANDGSEWTKVHKPISVVEIHDNAHPMDEDKITKMYMSKYGIDRVRGGSYTTIVLPEYKRKCIEDELCTANKTGHFAKDRQDQNPQDVLYKCSHCEFCCSSKKVLELHQAFCIHRPVENIASSLYSVLDMTAMGVITTLSSLFTIHEDGSRH